MHEVMAEEFVNSGDAAAAITQYEETPAKDPALPGVHYELGEAILQNSTAPDSLQRAEREFKAALAENPHNAGAEAKLGRVDMLREKRLKAKQDYRRALILDPSQIDALKGMAEICTRAGETETALNYLIRADRSAPFDVSVHYQLASLYRKLGRTDDARRELAEFQRLSAIKDETSLARQRSRKYVPASSGPH